MKTFSAPSFIAGLAIGVLFSVVWFYGNTSWSSALAPGQAAGSTTPTQSRGNSAGGPATSTPANPSNVLSVSDQAAGNTVVIESVTVPPPGVWVAVREVSAGELGNVLGAARAGGPRENVQVPLLRPTMPGRTYAVELYRPDTATSSTFSLNESVYVDLASDKPVIVYFNTLG